MNPNSNELKFIINLLFENSKDSYENIRKINFEKVIKIASSQLLIPAIYLKN